MDTWIANLTFSVAYILIGVVAAWLLPTFVATMVVSAADARTAAGLTPRRRATVLGLAKHLSRAVIYGVTAIFVLSLFVNSAGLFTFLGLFSAAFGLGARPLVQDYISGVVVFFLYKKKNG